MKPEKPERTVGLKSIQSAREDRGRGKYSRMTPNVMLVALVGVVGVLIAYWFFSQRSLAEQKSNLLAKQHAAVATVGAEWFPMRDKIEGIVLDSAKSFPDQDFIAPDHFDFRAMPGIYLRLRVAEARDVASVRSAAQNSVKDAVCGCLLKEPNPSALRGDADAGGAPEQPWNMRQAYASTRILTDEWANEVRDSSDDLRLRVFQQQYDQAVNGEIAQSIDIIKRARFFLLVLDEDEPEAKTKADGGAITEEILQTVEHESRVRIVDTQTWKDIAVLRRTGVGDLVQVGENHGPVDSESRDSTSRQVKNCSLGMQVSRALGFDKDRAPPQ
ncbi:MAG: hypothetical protein ACRELY_12520 [Polyangiaceae bacterium]